MCGCVGEMSWSVDIEAIPPPAPGWDTGWGEEGRWEENNDKACSRILQFYECGKCRKIFKHRKSLKRHNIHIPNCEHNQENIPGRNFEQLTLSRFPKIHAGLNQVPSSKMLSSQQILLT